MATKLAIITAVGAGAVKIEWSGLGTGDDGDWVNTARFRKITAHVSGTATTFALQGSNEAAGANPQTVKDANNTAITGAGLHEVQQVPGSLRPLLTTGTAVTVTLTCS